MRGLIVKKMNYHVLLLVLFTLTTFKFVSTSPSVFSENFSFCSRPINLKGKTAKFSEQLWTINNRDFTLHFSLCKTPQNACQNKTASCLIPKTTNNIIDLGNDFAIYENFILNSTNGARCPSNHNKNYTLKISLECSDSMRTKPRLLESDEEDECLFEVSMLKPGCKPRCTEIIDGLHVVDIKKFPKNIPIENDSKKFSLSLCGSNTNCEGDSSACEIVGEQKMPLGDIESQYLGFDHARNELMAKAKYKYNGVTRRIEVLIKCNWETDLANPVYKKLQTQGARYKFELESSYGCVKIPHSCRVSGLDTLHYDLNGLSKAEGWLVQGSPNGEIRLNICGPLVESHNICADQYSQVCEESSGQYLNRGSILLPLKIENENVVARIVSGAKCGTNFSLFYSTKIEFRCSNIERGPTFHKFENCTMVLTWETPKACAVDIYTSDNCYINDRFSGRNLQKLHEDGDRVLNLTETTKLSYNFCGPINGSCNNLTNVAICLRKATGDFILGFDNRNVISENGMLRMEFKGEVCRKSGEISMIKVDFVCDYGSNSTEVIVVEDECKYDLKVHTKHACASKHKFLNCEITNENMTYDLSSLTQKSQNYLIQAGNIDYSLNICGPIITGPGTLCRGDSMVCQYNKTEINLKHKFTSLGGVSSPRILDGNLVIVAPMGEFCPGFTYYKSIITFKCSQDHSPPTLISQNGCTYNFEWQTPVACPINHNCLINGTQTDLSLDLSNLQKKTLKLSVANVIYKFQLCSDTYIQIVNGTHNFATLSREFFKLDQHSFVSLDLHKTCNKIDVSKVNFKFECSNVESFLQTSFENCEANITIKTGVICTHKPETTIVYKVVAVTERIRQNCTVTNPYTSYNFSLEKLSSFEDSDISINFNGSKTCGGIFCKNDVEIVAGTCPAVTYNYKKNYVNLEYVTTEKCSTDEISTYKLDVRLQCNGSNEAGPKIIKRNCTYAVVYELSEFCLLIKQEIIAAGHTAVLPATISTILIVVCCALFIYFMRRRALRRKMYRTLNSSKTSVPIYSRMSNLVQYTEENEHLADKTACAGVRADLKLCLLESDCCKIDKKTPKECLRSSNVPTECLALRNTFFECKRSILDNRQRFRGRKGY